MSIWRRLFGFDPAGKDSSGVVAYRLRGSGGIHVDEEQLRRSMDVAAEHVRRHGLPGGLLQPKSPMLASLEKQLMDYSPPDPKGKPLPDRESKRPLHLDDYQPRGTEHPALRVVRERSFPEPPPMTFEDVRANQYGWSRERARDWVHYRNRHPGIRDSALGTYPPMRNALHDLLAFLADFNDDLQLRGLVAVEVGVQHEPAEQVEGEPQGWHFRVEALTVPVEALAVEGKWHEQYKEAVAKATAEAEERIKAASRRP